MPQSKIKILGICGSLRPGSSARAILGLVVNLVPSDVSFEIYNGLEEIPAFNDSNEMPASVDHLINLITKAEAVFFCIPEYAFGVPGALKNALDWTVSSTAFTDKPVALITAASQGDKAHASLLQTLEALGTKTGEGSTLLIPYVRSKLNEKNEVKDISTMNAIKDVVSTFIKSIERLK